MADSAEVLRADEIAGKAQAATEQPVTFPVSFLRGMNTRGNRPQNPYYFGGAGEVGFDAATFRLKGKNADVLWGGEFEEHSFPLASLRNASCEDTKLRVDVLEPGPPPRSLEVVFWAKDAKTAAEIFARLPKVQTEEYATRTRENADFDARSKAKTPHVFVTPILMALTIVAMVLESIGHGDMVGKWLSDAGMIGPAAYWARLIASVFVPSAPLGAAIGLFTLYMTGSTAERVYGNGNFLVIYLVAGVAGAFASALWHESAGPAVTSGAFFGLIGAFLAYFRKRDNAVPKTVARENNGVAVFLLGVSVLGGIPAHADYVAGAVALVAGFVLGSAIGRPLEAPGPKAP